MFIRLRKQKDKAAIKVAKKIKSPVYGFGQRPTIQCLTCGHTRPSNQVSCGFCAMIAHKSMV